MAIWQFDAYIIPSASLEARYGAVPLLMTRRDFEDCDWWSGIFTDHISADLRVLLPSCPSWTTNICMYGAEDGDRIDLVGGQGRLHDVFVRIDVREVSYRFIGQLCALCEKHACRLLIDGGRIIRPTAREVLRAIERSKAFAFVSDPEGFLRELKRQHSD